MTEEQTETEEFVIKGQRRSQGRGGDETDLPADNDDVIPLFQTLDKDARHVVVAIEVWKLDPPNHGIRGEVPPNTTLSFIANQFGNGVYEFRAKNAKGKVIRRETNVPVNFPTPPRPTQVANVSHDMASTLLDRQERRVEADMARHTQMADKTLETTATLAKSYAEMQAEDARQRSARDREYFSAQQGQQQTFFATLLTAMQTMHNQSMESQRESFAQTMQMMQTSNAQMMQMNNPALMLQLFREGMEMGQGASTDDPVVTAIREGGGAIKNFRDMMQLQNEAEARKLGKGTEKTQKPASTPKRGAFSRAEVTKLLRLKQGLEKKGYDFESLIDQVSGMYANQEGNEDDEPEPVESDSGTAHVEGGDS